jgi:hypothetical protein
MMAKINPLSICRVALLALALALTGLGLLPPAAAACTPGATRTIIVNIFCCGSVPPPKATKQRQVCNSSGVWVNSGSPFCGAVTACAV